MAKEKENPIEEYFAKQEGNKEVLIARELFKGGADVDLKTDLQAEEIVLLNNLMWNDNFLKSRGMRPLYESFTTSFMRLKISLERKSRGEFVDMNRSDRTEETLNRLGTLSNIKGTKV